MKNIKEIYSAYEEYNPMILDKFNRYRAYMCSRSAITPIISEFLYNKGFRPKYKDGKKSAICISHDIDFLYETKARYQYLRPALKALKKGNLNSGYYNFKSLFKTSPNPDWAIDKLIEFESKHKINSTYFFLALDQGEDDYNYNIESLKNYFKRIIDSGSEIGMHGGHLAFNNISKIEDERKKLEQAAGIKVKGYRNHYLRFKTPDTWEHLYKLNFLYDTTFGFPDLTGFRNGLCYPFRPYNYLSNTFIDIIEIPLIVMDVTFFKYLGLGVKESFKLFEKIFLEIKNLSGVLSLLWHNNCLTDDYLDLYHLIFQKILDENETWITTSEELVTWWKENNLEEMEKILINSF